MERIKFPVRNPAIEKLVCIDDGDYGAYRMLNNQTRERNKFYLTRRSAKLGRKRIK